MERVYDLFVGGCNSETSADDINNYCKNIQVYLKKVEVLQTKSEWYKAFKISMMQSDRVKLLNPDSWPKGVFVRKFYNARTARSS